MKRFDFAYMSPADAAAAEAEAAAAWQAGMDEFAALQEWLLFRTWRFGVLFAGYLLLAASGEVRKPGDLYVSVTAWRGCCQPPPRRTAWAGPEQLANTS